MSGVEILSNRWGLFKASRRNTNLPNSLTMKWTGRCCSEPHGLNLKSRDLTFFPMKPKVGTMSQILAMSLQDSPLLPAQPQHRLRLLLLQRPWQPTAKVRHIWGLEVTPKARDKSCCFILPQFAPFQRIIAPLGVKQCSQEQHKDWLPLLINIKWGKSNFL